MLNAAAKQNCPKLCLQSRITFDVWWGKRAYSHPSREHWNLSRCYWFQCRSSGHVDDSDTQQWVGLDVQPSITSLPVVCWDCYCPANRLDISQQPVWRWDARLGEVVPPPWFLLPLYPPLTYDWLAVALKLIVGVESIPCVDCGEEVVVDIGLHRNLDAGKGWSDCVDWLKSLCMFDFMIEYDIYCTLNLLCISCISCIRGHGL